MRRITAWALGALLLSLLTGPSAGAQTQPAAPAPLPSTAQQDFSRAQFVQVTLGSPNLEAGLRLVEGQPDGLTEPTAEGAGRRSLPSPSGPNRFFYFDVHDTYIRGGLNRVIMTITYFDRGLTPIFLEYDSMDVLQPTSKHQTVTHKRIPLVTRTDSSAWRTERIVIEDARFEGSQGGGADFRIGSNDELLLRNLAVFRVSHQEVKLPPKIFLDGTEVTFDVLPYIDPKTERTLVPMRRMLNALGVADEQIEWYQETRTVVARKGQNTIVLTVDSADAFVNGKLVKLDQPAVVKYERTLAPLRFVSESFGLTVGWDQKAWAIRLSTKPPDGGAQAPGTTPTAPPPPPPDPYRPKLPAEDA